MSKRQPDNNPLNKDQRRNVAAVRNPEEREALVRKYLQRNRKRAAELGLAGPHPLDGLSMEERRKQSISYKVGQTRASRKHKWSGRNRLSNQDIGLHGTSTSARGGGSLGTYWARR